MSRKQWQLFEKSKELRKLVDARPVKRFSPSKVSMDEVHSSPIFNNPQKWTSQMRMISEKERIQSYIPLDNSIMGNVLSSPPRMVHAARTVIPRDLLLAMKVSELPYLNSSKKAEYIKSTKTDSEKSSKKQKKKTEIKYIISPYHLDEKKVPEDPVTYYPKILSIFEGYCKRSSSDLNGNVPLQKFSMNFSVYSSKFDVQAIGWNMNTSTVINSIVKEKLEKEISCLCPCRGDAKGPKLVLVEEESDGVLDQTNLLTVRNGVLTLNIAWMKQHNPSLVDMLNHISTNNEIPITTVTTLALSRLVTYAMFLERLST
jgi:hypothetical protein